VTKAREGACENQPCACPMNIAKVCGVDGNTYDNECILKCA